MLSIRLSLLTLRKPYKLLRFIRLRFNATILDIQVLIKLLPIGNALNTWIEARRAEVFVPASILYITVMPSLTYRLYIPLYFFIGLRI